MSIMEEQDLTKFMKHLNCPVCNKVMHIPKYLPCKHTVCYECLKYHIVQTVPMSGYDILEYLGKNDPDIKPVKESFECPVDECKTKISPRNPRKPTMEWASQMKNNTPLLSVLKLCTGELPCTSQSCDKCSQLAWKSPVESLCFTCCQKVCLKCEYIHKELFPDHVVCKVPKSIPPQGMNNLFKPRAAESKAFNFPVQNDALTVCKLHKPQRMTMFCLTCLEECCEKCCDNKHSQCSGKTTSNDLSSAFKNKEVIGQTLSSLETCRERCLTTSSEFVVMLQEIGQKKMVLDSGKIVLTDTELQASIESLQHTLQHYINRFEYLRDSIQDCTVRLTVTKTAEHTDSFAACNIVQSQKLCNEIEKQITDNGKMAAEMKQKVDSQIKTLTEITESDDKEETSMESVFAAFLHGKVFVEVLDESDNVKLQMKLMAKCGSDVKDCWLTDCQFMDDNCIVVTDNDNKKLKLVTLDGEVKEEAEFETGPWGVAVNKDHLICVTLPDTCSMEMFEATASDEGYTLNNIRQHTFQTACYGVTFLDSHIAVTIGAKAANGIVVLNEYGIQLREIKLDQVLSKYIASSTMGGTYKIAFSEFRQQKLVLLDLKESDLGSDSPVCLSNGTKSGYATGLHIGTTNEIVYCNNRDGTVCRIRLDAQSEEKDENAPMDAQAGEVTAADVPEEAREAILVKGLCMPRSLAYREASQRLAVTVDSGPQKNYVCIYEKC